MVKNLAANAGKFCKRIIHVSLRKYKLVLTRVVKKKVNKSKSHKSSGNIKIRTKSIYSINIRQYNANIKHNTRYIRGKKYGWIKSIYNVHIGKCNIVRVCKKPVWRAGKPWVHKQYRKCTVSIRKQKATGRTHVGRARSKSARKYKNIKRHTCVTVNMYRVVYIRLSNIYETVNSNSVYKMYQNLVTEYTVGNIRKVMYSRRSRINIEKDRRLVRCVNISIIKCTPMVTVVSTHRSVYVTEMASNGTKYFSVSLKMDPRIAEELDKDMDTDTHKTVVTHGKKCYHMFSGELMRNPGANYTNLLHICLPEKLSASCSRCYRPYVNKCVVLSVNIVPISSNHNLLLCLVDNDNMFVNLTIYLYACSCAYQYRVVYIVNIVNEPHHKFSRTVRNIIYVYSITSRLYKVSKVHSISTHKADGDSSRTCRVLPSILGKTLKGINLTVSKTNSRYGE